VPFYVRLGPRGILFRVGTFLIGLIGSAVYRRASKRRERNSPLNNGVAPMAIRPRVQARRPGMAPGLAQVPSVGNN
jgi:hypothetical protein